MASATRSRSKKRASPAPAAAAAAVTAAPNLRAGRAVKNLTVGDADALDCGVCFLALRPPIFQCEVGHLLCSACRDKLEATGNGTCHVCRVATPTYRRCYGMECLVDTIRAPCPYSAHGCDATPPYHAQESHRQVCPHAPCHCPGDACGFIGSIPALLDHIDGAHNWPDAKQVTAGNKYRVSLLPGFNFFLLANHAGDDQAAAACSVPCLFLLHVTPQERFGRAISVLCVHPHANGVDQPLSTRCKLIFSRSGHDRSHYQSSEFFNVLCTDLHNGLPSSDGCSPFVVPNAVLGDDNQDIIPVRVCFSIN